MSFASSLDRPAPPLGLRAGTRAAPQVRAERYTFLDQLGEGGHGRVLRARDRDMGCDVAAKVLAGVAPDDIYRLKREFRLLAGVAHPNLVELHDLVVDGERSFLTMELIDGEGFLQHVRGRAQAGADVPGPLGPEGIERLRAALAQLAAGLGALHASGRLHCDIKPANVMVARDGRVVILDFGLVTSLRPDDGRDERGFAGTVDYIAPEQAWGQELSPATDWYSVGVMLFEALTGRLPFEGPPARTLVARTRSAPRPSAIAPACPADLDELVVRLLDPDPARRVGADAVLACAAAPPVGVAPPIGEPPFIGRAGVLDRLRALAADAARGGPILVHVRGGSGIGKTALLRELSLRLEEGGALVLRGRCHPQESVPYQGLDGAVDALTRALALLDAEIAAALVPPEAAALSRLFPVLRRLPEWDAAHADAAEAAAPELRRRAVGALRALLAGLAARSPIALWIDDVHWGDPDTIALLCDLLRPPDAPRLLVLLSYRADDPGATELLAPLRHDDGLARIAAHDVEIGPLEGEEVRALTRAWWKDRAHLVERHLEAIAEESRGSPFLAGELARWMVTSGAAGADGTAEDPVPPGVPRIVADRLRRLPLSARRLLEIAAVAGRPLPRGVALEAAGLARGAGATIPRLRVEQLLRAAASAAGAAVEPAHDRIREAVLAALSPEELRARHGAIAAALEASADPDPELLVDHLVAAGEALRASGHALAAAVRAEEALAWNRAARALQRALDLGAGSDERWRLLARLAAALAGAGRTAEAASAYRRAADALEVLEPAHAELLALRGRAAEQHLRGGEVEAGVAMLREVLAAAGVSWPGTSLAAIATILTARVQLALRGFDPRPARGVVPHELRRALDACWSACLGLNMTDLLRSASFQARHAVLALRAGDPYHLARALGTEMAYRGCEGGAAGRARAAQLAASAARIAARDPEDAAFVEVCLTAGRYYEGRFLDALDHASSGEAFFIRRHDGLTWEITNCWMYRAWSLAWLGELTELGRFLPEALARARAQHNLLAQAGLAGAHANLVWLVAGRPDEARACSDAAIASFPAGSFQSPHYAHLIAQTRIDLYEGRGEAAHLRVEAAWPKLRAAQLLRMQLIRIELRHLRASAALAAAADSARRRTALVRLAEREAARIAGEDHPCAAPLAALLRAGVLGARGSAGEAREAYVEAARACDRAGLKLFAAAGQVQAGDEAGAGWMREQRVAEPARIAAVMAPSTS